MQCNHIVIITICHHEIAVLFSLNWGTFLESPRNYASAESSPLASPFVCLSDNFIISF